MNKDFRIALTQAIDKTGLHRRDLRGPRPGRQQLRHARHPGLPRRLDPYPFDLDAAKAHMATALAGLGVRERGGPRQAQVRLQLRRRPRAARRVPGRGLADRRSVSRPSRSAATFSVFLTAAHGRRVRASPATAGVPTTRTRTTSSWPVHLRRRQQRRASTATRTSTRYRPGRRRARSGQAGSALQAGSDRS